VVEAAWALAWALRDSSFDWFDAVCLGLLPMLWVPFRLAATKSLLATGAAAATASWFWLFSAAALFPAGPCATGLFIFLTTACLIPLSNSLVLALVATWRLTRWMYGRLAQPREVHAS
jgi:hypothetical protein